MGLLFIVARHRPDRLNALKPQFAREEEAGKVQVFLDRRRGEGRWEFQPRKLDRRRHSDINNRLRSLGCAIVRQRERTPLS